MQDNSQFVIGGIKNGVYTEEIETTRLLDPIPRPYSIYRLMESRYAVALIPLILATPFTLHKTVTHYADIINFSSPALPLDIALLLIGTVGVLYATGLALVGGRLAVKEGLRPREATAVFLYSLVVCLIVLQPAIEYFDLVGTGLFFYHNVLLPVLFIITCMTGPYFRRLAPR